MLDNFRIMPIIMTVTEIGVSSLKGRIAQSNSYYAATQPSHVLRISVTGIPARGAAGLL